MENEELSPESDYPQNVKDDLSPYKNKNVRIILLFFFLISISGSILWFSSTWLIYGIGGSNADLGWVLGASTFLGSLFTVVTSVMADRLRKDLIAVGGYVVAFAGMVVLSYSTSLSEVMIGNILYSMGTSSLFPIVTALFADSLKTEHRNKVFGTNFMISEMAHATGNILGYFVFLKMDTTTIENLDVGLIQLTIKIATIIAGFGLIVVVFIKDSNTISQDDEGSIASQHTLIENDLLDTPSDQSFIKRIILKIINPDDFAPGAIKILLLTLLSSYTIGLGAGITIPYLNRFFFDIYLINLAELSLLFAGMTVFTGFWGKFNAHYADRFGNIELIVINQLISVTLLVILAGQPIIFLALMVLFVRNAAMNGTMPLVTKIQMDQTPRKYRSQLNAANGISWAVFFSLGQIIGGRVVDDHGFTIPILTTAVLYFISTIFYWRVKKVEAKKIIRF